MFRHQSVLTSSNAVHVLGNKVIKCINIKSYLFGSIEVNLPCKNSHYYTVQEKKFPILFAS